MVRRRCSATSSGVAGISALERLEQPFVVGHPVRPRVVGVMTEEHARLGRERVVGALEARAARQPHHLLVEAEVGVDHVHRHVVVVAGHLAQLVERRANAVEIGRRQLEDPPRGADLDRLAGDVDVEAVGQRHGAHEGAAMRLVLDEPLLDELADGLPHRAATGADRVRDRDLAQRLSLGDAALDDPLAQLPEHLLGHRRALDAREPPALRLRRHLSPSWGVDNHTNSSERQSSTVLEPRLTDKFIHL